MCRSKLCGILLCGIFSINLCFGQENLDIDQYFTDKRNSTKIIKTNITSVMMGDVSFSCEYVVNDVLSIELGTGLLLPYYTFESIFDVLSPEEKETLENLNFGYSLSLQSKLYSQAEAPFSTYFSGQIRRRCYSFENGNNLIFRDFFINYGLQINITKNLAIDASYGMGFRFVKDENRMKLLMPIGIKFGYFF